MPVLLFSQYEQKGVYVSRQYYIPLFPGGVVIIVTRLEYLSYGEEYQGRLEPLMQQMEQEGLWRQLERTVVKEYSFCKNGIIFVFKVK